MAKLTAKQEGFAKDVFSGMSQAAAYRANYSASKMTDESIHVAASNLMSNHKVRLRVEGLQAKAAEKAQVTVESLTLEMDENRKEAKAQGQTATMQSATMGKAKLHGLLVEKVDLAAKMTVNIGDDDADCG